MNKKYIINISLFLLIFVFLSNICFATENSNEENSAGYQEEEFFDDDNTENTENLEEQNNNEQEENQEETFASNNDEMLENIYDSLETINTNLVFVLDFYLIHIALLLSIVVYLFLHFMLERRKV